MYNKRSHTKRSFSRRSSPGRNGRGRGFNSRQRGGKNGQHIDVAKFVNKVTVTEESEIFQPEHLFSDFPVDERLKKTIAEKGYVSPTPIQDKSIPHILRGSDIVGIANTGTGKTAAFLVPLIHKVLNNKKERVLIVVPTRELALQIEEEFLSLKKGMNIFSVSVVGGAPIGKQIVALRRFPNFIIGTPGRLIDLVNRKIIKLQEFNTIVLDEADRMLDMGFISDIRFLIGEMPDIRHTIFFSATMSKEIESLIVHFLKDPVKISVKTRDTSKNVDQDVVRVQKDRKVDTLKELLLQEEFEKVLIFGRTKHGVENLSRILVRMGFKAQSIHGDKSHSQRQRALQLFKKDQVQVLVATDVAARGLDISDVSHVINFDIPATYEDYVHRIGRTGRGGKLGKALTFIEH